VPKPFLFASNAAQICDLSGVWVDGHFAKEHYGGLPSWGCEITSFVAAGHHALLTIEVSEHEKEINPGNKSGLFRKIKLLALPNV